MKVVDLLPNPLLDSWIRRKMRAHEVPLNRYTVRIARSLEEYEDAFSLVHIAYAYIGIENVRRDRYRITPQHVLPEATVIVAYEGDQLVGTMTVTQDSQAGLPLEKDFPEEVASARARRRKLVEFGSLSVVKRCYHTGVTTLLSMAANYWSTAVLGATHCVIGVHPKAAPFYRALYSFKPISKPLLHSDLHAPVIGLEMSFDEARSHLSQKLTRPCSTGKSLEEHFFEVPPDCVEIPTHLSKEQLTRWKLPREVFQEMFLRKTDRVRTLDPKTRERLMEERTDGTVLNKPLSLNLVA